MPGTYVPSLIWFSPKPPVVAGYVFRLLEKQRRLREVVRGMSVSMVSVAEEGEETKLCAHRHLRWSDWLGSLYSLFLLLSAPFC